MNYTDYSKILSGFGCHPVIRMPKTFPDDNWIEDKSAFLDIYSYVESGLPVLTSFRRHVATVVGHTTRSDLAFDCPDEHGFHESYALVDQYVVVDDNYFPYQVLGNHDEDVSRNYGRKFANQLDPFPSKQTIFSAVIPLPEKAFMEPHAARRIGKTFFAQSGVRSILSHVASQLETPNDAPLVTRLFLTSSNAFKRRKKESLEQVEAVGLDELGQFPLRIALPHFVWVMEISPLDLYNRRLVIGEVVIDASADFKERGFIYGRIGNRLVHGMNLSPECGPAIAFRQYTHNLGER